MNAQYNLIDVTCKTMAMNAELELQWNFEKAEGSLQKN
jgi:hypothetical protein